MWPDTLIIVDAARLGNIAYSLLSNLMEEGLADSEPELCSVVEAEFLVALKKALAQKSPYIILKVNYPQQEESK